ncbi:hypothetical protein [Myxococcus stipitatus]
MRLLPVEVASTTQTSAAMLEVVLPGGARLRFSPGTDVGYVARLLTALDR